MGERWKIQPPVSVPHPTAPSLHPLLFFFCFSVCIAPWIWRVQVMGFFCGAPKRTFCSRLPRCVWRMFHLGHFLHKNPKSKKNHPIQAILLGPLTLSLLAKTPTPPGDIRTKKFGFGFLFLPCWAGLLPDLRAYHW